MASVIAQGEPLDENARRVDLVRVGMQRAVHRPLVVRVLDGMHADGPRAEPRVPRKDLGELVPRPLHDARRPPVDDRRPGNILHARLAVHQGDLVEVGTQPDGGVLGLVDAVLLAVPVAGEGADAADAVLGDEGLERVAGEALEAALDVGDRRLLAVGLLFAVKVLVDERAPARPLEELVLGPGVDAVHGPVLLQKTRCVSPVSRTPRDDGPVAPLPVSYTHLTLPTKA